MKISKLPDGFLSHPKASNDYAKVGRRVGQECGVVPSNLVYEVTKVLGQELHDKHSGGDPKISRMLGTENRMCSMVKVKKIRGQDKSGFELDIKEPQPICEFFII